EILSALVTRPHAALRVMATPAKTAFVNALLAPAGYLSLLAPGGLLPAAPVLLQRLLSGRASEASIAYHYQAEFIPFIFVAAVHGAARLFGAAGAKSPAGEPLPASFRSGVTRRGRLLLGALLALFPPVGLWATRVPQQLVAAIGGGDRDPFITDVKRGIVRSVPPEARVVATFAFLPRLANRRELHSLHHVYTGRHTLSDVPYPAPDADVLIMDTHDPLTFSAGGFYAPDNYRNLRALLARPGWKPVRHVEGLLVFRRGGAGGAEVRLVEIAGGQCGGDVAQDAAEPLRLTGFELGPPDKEGVADLTLCWRWSPGARPRDCGAELQINAGNHALYRGVVYPGSRIRPPQSWPEGVSVRDAHRVRVSPAPAEGARASIRVRLVPADSPAARGGRHSGPRGGP
ncbi:MAG: DUF2079 domain-containing protein, partial [Lentisphaerae bacterium]|nr:DUF2079 domain-containing protein [Lentisphaerota bacterium]